MCIERIVCCFFVTGGSNKTLPVFRDIVFYINEEGENWLQVPLQDTNFIGNIS